MPVLESKNTTRRFLLGVTIALAVLTSLPYLYGYLRQTSELTYLGLHGFAPGDPMVYRSYLWQARDGAAVFADLYTTERAVFPLLNTFWAAAGWLGGWLQLPVPATFHLARLAIIPLAVAAVWWWLQLYLSGAARRWGLLLATFGSGLSGYLLPFLKAPRDLPGYYHLPMDLWVAEFSLFTSALHSGHLLAALAAIAVIFASSARAAATGRWSWSLAAGLAAALLFSFHPFHVPLVFSVLLVWSALLACQGRGKFALRHLVVVAGLSAPVLLYYVAALRLDPVTIGRAARNLTLTPAWYLLIPALGALLPAALAGGWRIFQERRLREPQWLLLLTWAVVHLGLIFAPWIAYQRRLTTALTLPLVALAGHGWPQLAAALARRWRRPAPAPQLKLLAAGVALLLLFGLSNLVNLSNDLALMQQRHPLVFWPRPEVEAIATLRLLTDRSSVVLAHPLTSYLIPGFTGRRVVAGHQDVETLDYERKALEILWFYQGGGTPERRRQMLDRYGVTHVLAGPREVNGDWSSLDALPYLREIWRNEAVRIYRVAD